jgi:hypothetical protein
VDELVSTVSTYDEPTYEEEAAYNNTAYENQENYQNGQYEDNGLQYYLDTLASDPTNAEAYNALGTILPAEQDNIILYDGRALTRKDLFLEAITYDPSHCNALYNLSTYMDSDETITLPGIF